MVTDDAQFVIHIFLIEVLINAGLQILKSLHCAFPSG